MNFLACDGDFFLDVDGQLSCSGELKTYTLQEMRDELSPQYESADMAVITSNLISFFVLITVLVKLRKLA